MTTDLDKYGLVDNGIQLKDFDLPRGVRAVAFGRDTIFAEEEHVIKVSFN